MLHANQSLRVILPPPPAELRFMPVCKKCFLARVGGGRFLEPESDQQIAGHADQLPEDEHHDEIGGQHDAEHRKGEEAQTGEVTRAARIVLHVAGRINVDRAANAGDDEKHQQAEAVEVQAELDPEVADFEPVQCGGRGRRRGFQRAEQRHGQCAGREEGEHDGADRKRGAELRIALGKERDDHRRRQWQQQDDPGNVGKVVHANQYFIVVRSSTWADWRLR